MKIKEAMEAVKEAKDVIIALSIAFAAAGWIGDKALTAYKNNAAVPVLEQKMSHMERMLKKIEAKLDIKEDE